jgi:type-F conjugative transfer system pilin assembly protein TrbC
VRSNFYRFVMIAAIGLMSIFLSVSLSVRAAIADDMKDLHDLMDTAQNQQIDVTEITKNKTAEKIAEQTAKTFHSQVFQKRLQTQIDTLRSQLNSTGEEPSPISRKESCQDSLLMPGEKIYLFISSSMPEITLRNYAQDLDKLGDRNIVMVMQGFVDGVKYITPTLEFIQNILKKSPSCDSESMVCEAFNAGVYIDPQAFARYGITAVPAVVYARDENEENLKDAYRVSGEVSLEYALERIEKESKSSQIRHALKKLRKGFY